MNLPELRPSPAAAPRPPRRHGLARSFLFAGQGIAYVIRTQRNFRIQLIAGTLACAAAAWVGFSAVEWAILAFTIAGVLVLEMLNTVVEAIVDLLSPGYHPLAKVAKDVAAGAVLIASLAAALIGALLFWTHLR